jgi:hypothetical protein
VPLVEITRFAGMFRGLLKCGGWDSNPINRGGRARIARCLLGSGVPSCGVWLRLVPEVVPQIRPARRYVFVHDLEITIGRNSDGAVVSSMVVLNAEWIIET